MAHVNETVAYEFSQISMQFIENFLKKLNDPTPSNNANNQTFFRAITCFFNEPVNIIIVTMICISNDLSPLRDSTETQTKKSKGCQIH